MYTISEICWDCNATHLLLFYRILRASYRVILTAAFTVFFIKQIKLFFVLRSYRDQHDKEVEIRRKGKLVTD